MAFGTATLTLASGAVNDIFAHDAFQTKAKGQRLEAEQYGSAAGLARQNEQFTKTSTEIKQAQLDREMFKTLGGQQADVAAGGFEASGSALDLLRDSASQGALTKAVAGQQGLIQEAGYEQQAKSFDLMQKASLQSADASDKAASNSYITAALKGIGAVATLIDPTGISNILAPAAIGAIEGSMAGGKGGE